MNYFKNILLIASVLFITSCGNNPENQQNQSELNQLKQENDSLKKELSSKSNNADSLIPIVNEEVTPVKERSQNIKKVGKHPITLQWISWDKPGTATIKPLDGEWYSINGSQENTNGDYLTIDGKLRRITEKELEFDGKIVTKTSTNNGGEPCIKTGKQTFYAKGNRTYFRLQNMINCEGGMLVDYVDIYTGNSSL